MYIYVYIFIVSAATMEIYLSARVPFSKESRCITRLVTLRAPPLREKQIRLEEEVARRRNTEARNLLKCTPMAMVVVLRARCLTSQDIFFKTDVRCIARSVAKDTAEP